MASSGWEVPVDEIVEENEVVLMAFSSTARWDYSMWRDRLSGSLLHRLRSFERASASERYCEWILTPKNLNQYRLSPSVLAEVLSLSMCLLRMMPKLIWIQP